MKFHNMTYALLDKVSSSMCQQLDQASPSPYVPSHRAAGRFWVYIVRVIDPRTLALPLFARVTSSYLNHEVATGVG